MMLGDLGARVIKVESATGDDTRAWGPPWAGRGRRADHEDSTYFMSANRNKESIVLDLKDADDAEVLAALVRRADVLLENFRVGVLDRLGFTVERLHELNPRPGDRQSITGFGHDGPEAGRAGYDQIAQGEGGLMSVTGTEQPTKVGVPIADLLAGMNLAYGVVAALHERHAHRRRARRPHVVAGRGGRRARVPGHPLDCSAARCRASPARTTRRSRRTGCSRPRTAPVQVARGVGGAVAALRGGGRARPGRAAVRAPTASGWRTATTWSRVIEGIFAAEPAEHWLDLLVDAGHPGRQGAVDGRRLRLGAGALAGAAARRRPPGVRRRCELPGSPMRFDDNAFSGGRERHLPPPLLGEHGAAIREWLEG